MSHDISFCHILSCHTILSFRLPYYFKASHDYLWHECEHVDLDFILLILGITLIASFISGSM